MSRSAAPDSRPWLALAWMMAAMASFVAMAIAGRAVSDEFTTFELMVYRSLIGWLIVLLAVLRLGQGFAPVHTRQFGRHMQRNVVHYVGQNAWFYGVAAIPLAQLVALEMSNPIWVAVLAPLLLHESMTRTRALAALVGFLGVLVVARPGVSPLDLGHGAALLAAVSFALTSIYTRRIVHDDSTLCLLFWMTLSQTVMSIAVSLASGGIPLPTAELLPWLVVAGFTGVSAHFALTSALAAAPATIVAPMEFLRLPVMALVGFALYGEPLDVFVLTGGAIIIGGVLLNIVAERRPREPGLR
ncbi:DMT family transporter [Amaricoccus macauensis]|uniref:DMT family transporter n=1 Tax=Amaricoccus macauensis TaxID=57001 RepID=UPI003C7DC8C6